MNLLTLCSEDFARKSSIQAEVLKRSSSRRPRGGGMGGARFVLLNSKWRRDIVKNSSPRESPEKSDLAKAGLKGHRHRLRERFVKSGLAGFHDHEILELLLTYAIPRRDVKPIAKALLSEFGNNLASVFDAPVEALERVGGIRKNVAVLICLMPRLFDSYQSSRWVRHETFGSTEAAVSYLQALLGTQRNEVFCVLALDSQNRLIAVEQCTEGKRKPDCRLPEAGRRSQSETSGNRCDSGS